MNNLKANAYILYFLFLSQSFATTVDPLFACFNAFKNLSIEEQKSAIATSYLDLFKGQGSANGTEWIAQMVEKRSPFHLPAGTVTKSATLENALKDFEHLLEEAGLKNEETETLLLRELGSFYKATKKTERSQGKKDKQSATTGKVEFTLPEKFYQGTQIPSNDGSFIVGIHEGTIPEILWRKSGNVTPVNMPHGRIENIQLSGDSKQMYALVKNAGDSSLYVGTLNGTEFENWEKLDIGTMKEKGTYGAFLKSPRPDELYITRPKEVVAYNIKTKQKTAYDVPPEFGSPLTIIDARRITFASEPEVALLSVSDGLQIKKLGSDQPVETFSEGKSYNKIVCVPEGFVLSNEKGALYWNRQSGDKTPVSFPEGFSPVMRGVWTPPHPLVYLRNENKVFFPLYDPRKSLHLVLFDLGSKKFTPPYPLGANTEVIGLSPDQKRLVIAHKRNATLFPMEELIQE